MRPILLFLFLLPAVLGFSQTKKQLKIESLERQRFEAMTTKNLAFLENVLTDDLTYTHSNGLVEDKTTHLENIRTGKLQYRSIQPEEMKLSIHRRTAVGTGIVNVTGVLNEKEFSIRLRYTDVYMKKKGKWRLAAWQSLKL
ncbi:MAG: nuclear transport factor 2 family protein [Saprospiraceae bacterium]|nr:nuclear transport factor 2 family protein [Saprospiraceae bacterium]MCF8250046.1 nuclear transport factor 2 family protein [Saprospiraceae bacterium]MCF8283297.1 nuclear transport factor 2 family protein [Bacteroidales bacterium]MCF8311988.1 nuclear transport factor 2 family protein [Saprospiraceae bacterium]MCF8440322.1 nuclear transport factor 2 family protein [Saprospiraceae bacterium]